MRRPDHLTTAPLGAREADPEVEFLVMPDLDGIWGNVLERGRLLRTWLFPSHFGKFSPSVLEIDA